MTIKESYDVAGLPTTWGVPAYAKNVAAKNAVVVDRLLGAGAVLFGKTNVPLYLGDWQSFNAIYGTTNNPWDVTRAPGGSSGGSAAALAAGLTALEAGSDIGSSIRNPAHFCGVYGHKPTWGIVPRTGQALPWQQAAPVDIDVVGPLARTADDLALALSIMAGPDPIEAAGWQLRLRAPRHKRLRDFKVALMLDTPDIAVDREVQDRLRALADFLRQQKVKVDEAARPAIDPREAFRVYTHLLRSATSDRQTDADFETNSGIARALPPGDESYRARAMRAAVMSHRDWLAFNETRHRMRLAVGGVLHPVRPAALPGRLHRGLPARPEGRPLRSHADGQRHAGPGDRPPVLGGLHRRVLSPVDRRAVRLHAERAAGGRADRGAAVRRSDVAGLRAAARARVPGLRAAARLRVSERGAWPRRHAEKDVESRREVVERCPVPGG